VTVDARLIFEGSIRELASYTVDPETQVIIQVGESREGDSLIVGVDPQTAIDTWVMQGRVLNSSDVWEAVIGDSTAHTMFTLPLSQSVAVQEGAFSIVGVRPDPINNGKVTYIPLRKLSSITNITMPNAVLVRIDPLVDHAATLTSLQEGVRSLNAQLRVYELEEVIENNLSFLNSLWSSVKVLPLFTLISAASCLIGFLMLAADEQRQELGVLRAVGAKPGTVTAILSIQSIIVLLASYAIGISLGTMTTLLVLVPEPLVTNSTILEIGGWLFTALLGMFFLSLLYAMRFAKKPILEILR
jgi:putative ABC transport system permease protein